MMRATTRRADAPGGFQAKAAIVLATLLVPLLASGSAPGQQPAEFTSLVQQLGDPGYANRVEAADQLLTAGRAAKGAVQAGLKDDDPQVRRSCRRLLAEISRIAALIPVLPVSWVRLSTISRSSSPSKRARTSGNQ